MSKNFLSKRQKKELIRAQMLLLLNQGLPKDSIMMISGCKRRRLFQIKKAYLSEGLEGIVDKRKPPPRFLLTKAEREEIKEILYQNTPLDYGYTEEFWTTAILSDFIKANYGIRYASRTSYYVLFKEAKFSFHKPGRVYEKKDAEVVEKWRKTAKKQLKKAWQDQETVILAADEMVLSTQTTFQKVWLPQGKYPNIEVSNTKKNLSIYGFLNIKTGQEHAYKRTKQTMLETVSCLKKISAIYADKKILLLWDSAGWHKGSEVTQYIEKAGNIDVMYFPPYSPEENPQEHVWKYGRQQVTHNKFIKDIDSATDDFVKLLRKTKFKYELLGFSAK